MDHVTRTKELLITLDALAKQPLGENTQMDIDWIRHVCATAVSAWENLPIRSGNYIYVASPLSSHSNTLERFRKMAAWLALEHYTKKAISAYVPVAVNPIIHENLISAGMTDATLTHEFWMGIDMGFLLGARELHVLCLTGWEKSKGIRMEIKAFEKTRRPVVYIKPDTYAPFMPPANELSGVI